MTNGLIPPISTLPRVGWLKGCHLTNPSPFNFLSIYARMVFSLSSASGAELLIKGIPIPASLDPPSLVRVSEGGFGGIKRFMLKDGTPK